MSRLLHWIDPRITVLTIPVRRLIVMLGVHLLKPNSLELAVVDYITTDPPIVTWRMMTSLIASLVAAGKLGLVPQLSSVA